MGTKTVKEVAKWEVDGICLRGLEVMEDEFQILIVSFRTLVLLYSHSYGHDTVTPKALLIPLIYTGESILH